MLKCRIFWSSSPVPTAACRTTVPTWWNPWVLHRSPGLWHWPWIHEWWHWTWLMDKIQWTSWSGQHSGFRIWVLVQDFVHQELRRVCAIFVQCTKYLHVRSRYLSGKAVFSATRASTSTTTCTTRTTIGTTARGISIGQVGRWVGHRMLSPKKHALILVEEFPSLLRHCQGMNRTWVNNPIWDLATAREETRRVYLQNTYLQRADFIVCTHPSSCLQLMCFRVGSVGIDEESMEVD